MSLHTCEPIAHVDMSDCSRPAPESKARNFHEIVHTRVEPGRVSRLVEAAVIPRLVLSNLGSTAPDLRPPAPSRETIERMSHLALTGEPDAAFSFAEELRLGGFSVETLFLDVMAPASRQLANMAAADVIGDTELMIGLWHLQHALRRLSAIFQGEVPCCHTGRRVLILLAPGGQHSFGLAMAAEFFLRAGWGVAGGPGLDGTAIAAYVEREWFDVVVYAIEAAPEETKLKAQIQTIRAKSRNRAVRILGNGYPTCDHMDVLRKAGADISTIDARRAVLKAEQLVDLAAASS